MKKLLRTFAASFVALAVVVVAANADELFGVLTKVDADAKKVTVVEKDTDKEILVTITDDTEYVTKKGSNKIDLEKVATTVKKVQDAGKKGLSVKVTHEKGKASKIAPVFKNIAAAVKPEGPTVQVGPQLLRSPPPRPSPGGG